MAEIPSKYEIFLNQVTEWKKKFLAGESNVFENKKQIENKETDDSIVLYEQIGRFRMDLAILKKAIMIPIKNDLA